MNIELTPHATELLEAVRAKRKEPPERIFECAPEVFVREEQIETRRPRSSEGQRRPARGGSQHARFRQAKSRQPRRKRFGQGPDS